MIYILWPLSKHLGNYYENKRIYVHNKKNSHHFIELILKLFTINQPPSIIVFIINLPIRRIANVRKRPNINRLLSHLWNYHFTDRVLFNCLEIINFWIMDVIPQARFAFQNHFLSYADVQLPSSPKFP